MGYAARRRERQWIGLYQLSRWWRLRLLLRWPAWRAWTRIFRGGLWRWLTGCRRLPSWLAVRADHARIRAAQRYASDAARLAKASAARARRG